MSGAAQISQADRAWWQRQAAAELTRILDTHPELPAIAWTIGPAGCVLAGRVSGLSPARRIRDLFGVWQAALALEPSREQPGGGGAVFLHAAARRSGVMVRVIATVFEDEEDW